MTLLHRGYRALATIALEKRSWLAARAPVAVHLNALGDRLIVLPALRALCTLFPGRLTLVASEGDRERFYSDLPLKSFVVCPWRYVSGQRRFDPGEVAKAVGECDLLASFNSWHSADLDGLIDAFPGTRTLGHFRRFGARVPLRDYLNANDQAFDLARRLDRRLRLVDFAGPPRLPRDEAALATKLRESVPSGARVLAVHTEPALASKRWPAERFRRVLDAFLERHPDFVAMVVDYRASDLVPPRHARRVVPCPGTPLGTAMALVGGADLFLGVDSCMLHTADLFRVPGVALFGPTPWRRWGFRFAPHRHVAVEGPMEDITEDRVLRALEELAREHPDARAPLDAVTERRAG